MKISEQALQLIRKWEGCRLEAYLDPVGIATIGYGCIVYPDGRRVRLGDRISQEQAEALLLAECQRKAEAVDRLISVAINQNQFDALVSLAFNIGEGAFADSTLLRRLNDGDHAAASEQILVWNKGTVDGGKREIAGLSNRRREEKLLFDRDAASAAQPISLDPSPQQRVTWLEAYGEQGKTVIVAWDRSEVVEILALQSPSKTVLIEVLAQYPHASNLLIAAAGKPVPSGERLLVPDRRSALSPGGPAQAAPIPPAPAVVLARGSRGRDVTVLQERLEALGFYAGPRDGDFGSGTDLAARAFQAEHFGAAEADGRVGPRTWAALWNQSAGAGPSSPAAPAQPGASDKTYLRLTRTGARDRFGLTILQLAYIRSGTVQGSLNVCSGAPGRQAFRTGAQSRALSFEPLPEGVWAIHTIEWCDGKDQYNGRIFESGLGPVSIPLSYRGPGSTARSAIEIHIDWNKNDGAPGTAGCIGIHSIADYRTLVSWLRQSDPQELFVDWGLGTCPTP